ncbi:hypothetical protein ACH427_31180 [Streptomyces sp. NPDC020379]|uniref:hypothetical protein n=1 Tax=Streptomyces sp. NPDC020379 TaxID=3365071 RepID=UPI0037BD6F4A
MMSATVSLAATHLVPFAAEDLDKNKVTPGVLGFIVFALLGAAVWMLMKSMNKHMKKVAFEEIPEGATAMAAAPASASAPAVRGGGKSGGKGGDATEG